MSGGTGPGPHRPDPSEADLSERLRRLGDRLDASTTEAQRAEPGPRQKATGGDNTMGAAMRLSTEFVAGVVAGALLGWAFDRALGTSPWGMIVLLLLGFGAGVMNVMRSAGMLGSTKTKP